MRHEIVHNRYVVDSLKAKGAVFVEELDEIPQTDQPVIFSAHGVPKAVPAAAEQRNMFYVDATCPLVSKVHIEAERLHARGYDILLIGHDGHPEVAGTMGQLPEGAITLIETVADARAYEARAPEKLAFVTQTTLSVDDTADIVTALKERFPDIVGPHKEDICYATTNRQAAVKAIAPRAEALLVIGAPNSSNSQRLVEVGKAEGCRVAHLVQRAVDIPWADLEGLGSVGITAGRERAGSAGGGNPRRDGRAFRTHDRNRDHGDRRRHLQNSARIAGLRCLNAANHPAWPFIPKLQPKTLPTSLRDMTSAGLVSMKGIAEGVENTNYLVTTEQPATTS